jgi:AP-4 complex subunit mu-1
VSPSLSFEILNRITKLIKDYCGMLSEDSIRTNFVLIYEILDEIMVRKGMER